MQAQVYWIDVSLKKIQRANVDGSCIEDVVSDLARPSGLALLRSAMPGASGPTVLWSDLEEKKIYGIDVAEENSTREVWVEGLKAPTGSSLGVDHEQDGKERLVWADLSLRQICMAERNGTPQVLVPDLQCPNSVVTHRGEVYWGDFGTRKIHKMNKEKNHEVLVPYGKNSTSLVVDSARGYLYWTNFGTNAIYRATLDGREMQPLITDLQSPSSLALASKAGKLYWLERPHGKLRRASIEGTQVEDVLTGLVDPWALAVMESLEDAAEILVPIEKYSWTDEGEMIKVYIIESSNAAAIAAAGDGSQSRLQVDFQQRSFTLMVRPQDGASFQLRLLGLLHQVVPEKCKVRLSPGKRITLSLAKKDPKVTWTALCNRNG